MTHRWFRNPKVLILTPLVLTLVFIIACGGAATPTSQPSPPATSAPGETQVAIPTATTAPTPTPAGAGEPVVNQLIMAGVFERESNDPINVIVLDWNQFAPMYDGLTRIGVDGSMTGMLAESWDVSPDLATWTWQLRKGVQWHKGFGEFTARDYMYTLSHAALPESVNSLTVWWRDFYDNNRVTMVDDYTLVMKLKEPRIDLHEHSEKSHSNLMLSKAHFDAEGKQGIEDNPIGTGPYQFVERVLGSHVLYERVPYQHYRSTPDFPELKIVRVIEHSTRLAMLLADEAHIALLPRDLQATAVENGMRIIQATLPTTALYVMFGGAFHPDGKIREGSMRTGEFPDLPFSDVFHPVTEVPWVNQKVRHALNIAVNREEIQETIYHGQGELMPVSGFHPTIRGWNPEWLERFDEAYGYDPERARELLAEVEEEIGQPLDWSKLLFVFTLRQGTPEVVDTAEAIQNYWKDVGVDLRIETMEFATFARHIISSSLGGIAWTDGTGRRVDPRLLEITYYSKNGRCCHFFEAQVLDDIYDELVVEPDLAKRDQLIREAGNYIFDEYAKVPLLWLFINFVVNPDIVADYPTPGDIGGLNLEDVVAVRK